MESMYPEGPAVVPEQLTVPGTAYRRHAWLAMAGLLAFVACYFGLLGWFGLTAWRMFEAIAAADSTAGSRDDSFLRILAGCFALFLAVFMGKALVFIKRGQASTDLELKPADQPELFAFLHRLADEAGAPRPHRVYLSPRVNAAVFYDLSIANLILPSRKNLEIGLGLANVLTLGEFKAVLAHEFGHFAQRTMAVGRWVYIAQQIASHIIAKRDALDGFLRVISGIDLRVAWIGWILQIIVWSIRSLVELLFRVVVLAQRALSREMEYQADLVAASLTGSDALVHALHRLNAADDAWSRAVGFASYQAAQQRPVLDVFAIQARIIERMRALLADPNYGAVPALPTDAAGHRLFRTELAQPPRMWSTHPANADREENVKRRYIAASIDERPAMILFRNSSALCERITREMFTGEQPAAVPMEESLARLDADFDRSSLARRYRGAYLGRCAFLPRKEASELYADVASDMPLGEAIAALYPEELGGHLDRMRALEQELGTLRALRAGLLDAPGGIVRWRGGEMRKRELPKAIADVEAELAIARNAVLDHDRRCRSLHAFAARRLGGEWEAYLRSLAVVAHYATHAEADIRDAAGLLDNTLQIVLADRKVSAAELKRVLIVARQLHRGMADVYEQAPQVALDEAVCTRLQSADWQQALGEFRLSVPDEANVDPWLRAVNGWTDSTAGALSALRRSCLEALLETEDRIAHWLENSSEERPAAPSPLKAPMHYPRLLPGLERKLQTKLGWWDRFQTADGIVASGARLVVAGGIVGAVLVAGGSIGRSQLQVYNGLAIPVTVTVDDVSAQVGPYQAQALTIAGDGRHHVEARSSAGGLIEAFDADTERGNSFAYNVGNAAALLAWSAPYGSITPPAAEKLGAPRWLATSADYVFVEPPTKIQTKDGPELKSVLSGFADVPPENLVDSVTTPADRQAMITMHARWDSTGSTRLLSWLMLAHELPGFDSMLQARLREAPRDVLLLRMQQDTAADPLAHDAVCSRQTAMAAQSPVDADLQYIALRCVAPGRDQDAGFLAARERWPGNPWLAQAAGYVHAGRMEWDDAVKLMTGAASKLPVAREWLYLDMARILRMQGSLPPADLSPLRGGSSLLTSMLALEDGEGTAGTPMSAYASLAKGEVQEGLALAAHAPAVADRVMWLAAASDGAGPLLPKQVLAQPRGKGVDESTLWHSLALTVREGGDASYLVEQGGKSRDEDAPAILRFFSAVQAGSDVASAEAALGSVSPRARGIAYSMAVILRGQRCPQAWREGAKRLLFAPERPYFG